MSSTDYIFSYTNMMSADSAINKHYLLLRCAPISNTCQIVKDLKVTHIGFDFVNTSIDSFGNNIMYGGTFEDHLSMYWQSSGIVSLSSYKIKNTQEPLVYMFNTDMTFASSNIKDLICDLKADSHNRMDFVFKVMDLVHNSIEYSQNVTNSQTKAEEALALKKGVCQDYAHLMLSILREFSIPCRYVNGFIQGEGQTHAWVDVLIDDYWHGFDPTHNIKIDLGYITLATGRDANDCSVSRGVYSSKCNNRMSAFVCVGRL